MTTFGRVSPDARFASLRSANEVAVLAGHLAWRLGSVHS
jgi:hypothetical protein